jgi:hypothetical protein
LPFNHIVQAFAGPYFVPADADDPAVLESFRTELENELLELTHYVHQQVGDVADERGREPRFGFPAGWEPSWDGAIPNRPFEPSCSHPALRQRGAEPEGEGARRRQRDAVARHLRRMSRSDATCTSNDRRG